MTANRALAKIRGISEHDIVLIDELHAEADKLMVEGLVSSDAAFVAKELERIEFALQSLWQFPQDKQFHTRPQLFLFRHGWHGRKFQCARTGVVHTIDASELRETELIRVGEGFVDVGRGNHYFRVVGCGELT